MRIELNWTELNWWCDRWGSGYPRSHALRNDPGTVTIPQYWFNKNKATHTSWPTSGPSSTGPPADGGTSLRHHPRPHVGSLGTTRSSNLREMICALTAEQGWLVRRGPGIGSHTGRRVRDGHLKGYLKINEIELNWTGVLNWSNAEAISGEGGNLNTIT